MSNSKITDQPMFRRYTPRAKKVIELAEREAQDLQQSNIEPAHLLLAIVQLREGIAYNILSPFDLNPVAIREIIQEHSQQKSLGNDEIDYSISALNIFRNAVDEANGLGYKYVGSEHVLVALIQEKDPIVTTIFDNYKVKPTEVMRTALKLMGANEQLAIKDTTGISLSDNITSSVKHLDSDLTTALNQIEQLQKETATNKQVMEQLQELAMSLTRVKERSEELKATIVLPPQEDMTVQLVPSHSLERLEEYRSDESISTLLIGLFGGSSIGIVVNWITNENISITRVSLIVLTLFLVLTMASVFWWNVIKRRADSIKNRMTMKNSTSYTENNSQ